MADSWENEADKDWDQQADNWDSDSFEPKVVLNTQKLSAVQKQDDFLGEEEEDLSEFMQPDDKRFEGEDEDEDDVVDSWEQATPKPQPKKREEKKYDESKGTVSTQDIPLDDPAAEKLRQQRLIEESDYQATKDLFGTTDNKTAVQNPLDIMIPKSEKDFEEYANKLVEMYILPHQKNKLYKKLLKEIMKHSLEPGTKDLAREVEQSISAIKAKKLKQENEEKARQKAGSKKVSLRVGSKGGDAGLEDYQYDDIIDGDEDFM